MYKMSKNFYIFLLIVSIIILSYSPQTFAQFGLYPSFGTTSLTGYGISPLFTNYSYTSYQNPYSYYSSPFSLLGTLSSPLGIDSSYNSLINLYKSIQYYQYLSYAYQFYLIARSTPMFYMNDIIADYIGSSLYSYATQNDLGPQQAILSFIQQHLL